MSEIPEYDQNINIICKYYNDSPKYFLSADIIVSADIDQKNIEDFYKTENGISCEYDSDITKDCESLIEAIICGLNLDINKENFILCLRKYININLFGYVKDYLLHFTPNYEKNFLVWFSQLFMIHICIHTSDNLNIKSEIYSVSPKAHEIHIIKHSDTSYSVLKQNNNNKQFHPDNTIIYNKNYCKFNNIYDQNQDNILEHHVQQNIDKLFSGYKFSYMDFGSSTKSTINVISLKKIFTLLMDKYKIFEKTYDSINLELKFIKGPVLNHDSKILKSKNYSTRDKILDDIIPLIKDRNSKKKSYLIEINITTIKDKMSYNSNILFGSIIFKKSDNMANILKKNKVSYSNSISIVCINMDLNLEEHSDIMLKEVKTIANLKNTIKQDISIIKTDLKRISKESIQIIKDIEIQPKPQPESPYIEILPETTENIYQKIENWDYEDDDNNSDKYYLTPISDIKEDTENDKIISNNDKLILNNDKLILNNDKLILNNDIDILNKEIDMEIDKSERDYDKELYNQIDEIYLSDEKDIMDDKSINDDDKSINDDDKSINDDDKSINDDDKSINDDDKSIIEDSISDSIDIDIDKKNVQYIFKRSNLFGIKYKRFLIK